MSHIAFIFLMSTAAIIISIVNGQSLYQSVSLDVAISKDQPTSVSMNCSLAQDTTRCTWRLASAGKTLTSEDYGNATVDGRYSVKMDSLLKSCFLDIDELDFDDQGFYICSLDDARPKTGYYLTIYGDPGSPLIAYHNGTQIDDTTIAVDEAPTVIQLSCISTGARPEHNQIQWLIDGKIPTQTTSLITESEEGGWTATSNLSLSFTEDEKQDFVIKTVTCRTDHETGEKSTVKVFGIRNTDKRVHLVYDNSTAAPNGILKCQTHMFPWPIMYEIVKLSNPPTNNDTYQGQELEVKEDGRYICRAMTIIRISPSKLYRWMDSNVVGLGVDPECPPGTASNTRFEISLMIVNLFLLYWISAHIN